MLADGSVVTCSRDENPELFRHVMGGYGLFGVILDLDVEMVPNVMLSPSVAPIEAKDFAPAFLKICHDPSVNMAFGRLDVTRGSFLEQALLIAYRPLPPEGEKLPPPGEPGMMASLTRDIYRAETGSEFGKKFRWFMEKSVGPHIGSHKATRNTLLNDRVVNLASHDATRTDILHEYFVPPDRFPDFLAACREVILKSQQELLNVTLRYVMPDSDSVLRYAGTERVCAVMSFSQLRTAEAEADMGDMTRNLIERVLAIGGTYYLPYRLHARREQTLRAYPALESFIETKRRYDSGLLFRNTMWESWVSPAKEG
jgi:FAD/FMN-containing dehydrogenase